MLSMQPAVMSGPAPDPFDELAQARCHSHSLRLRDRKLQLPLDPLEALWQDICTDPLGATVKLQPTETIEEPKPQLPASSITFELDWNQCSSPPSQPAALGLAATPEPCSASLPAADCSSAHIADLLGLDQPSATGRTQGPATGPGSRAVPQGPYLRVKPPSHFPHTTSHRASGGGSRADPEQGPPAPLHHRRSSRQHERGHSSSSRSSIAGGSDELPHSKPQGRSTAGEEHAAQQGAGQPGTPSTAQQQQRELFIYALPLSRDRLVFLPIAGWTDDPTQAPEGITGSLSSGLNRLSTNVATWWASLGSKEPDTLQHKIYKHGQAVIENMSAEERLMRNIPRAATKVVVRHPASVLPSQVQEQLSKMAAEFTLKATGKAAAAGLLLPVAVGIEIVAIPGAGWYALYQLYKSSAGAKGGQRLNSYLNGNVRVCYAGDERLDKYAERVRLSPDGLLTQDDVEDLCHDLEEPGLLHPLSELRSRYCKRIQRKTGDYALLPAKDVSDDESISSTAAPAAVKPGKRNGFWAHIGTPR
ncbi:hypothetical protein V8C86DRAFT_2734512 [Haematococcus lacustris]